MTESWLGMEGVAQAERGGHAPEISREMVRLMRKVAGRGPTKVRTTIGRDHVLVMLGDTLTTGEQNLVDNGYSEKVLAVRSAYQQVLRAEATEMVERVLDRRVMGFMSTNHFDPDLAAEIFVLEPEVEGSEASMVAEHEMPGDDSG
jgi:uncharacterized protein YbcI